MGKVKKGGYVLCNRLSGLERNVCWAVCWQIRVVGGGWGQQEAVYTHTTHTVYTHGE
jgi:hypothetical protein